MIKTETIVIGDNELTKEMRACVLGSYSNAGYYIRRDVDKTIITKEQVINFDGINFK